MKLLNQAIKAGDVVSLINTRLNNVTMKYNHAVANEDKVSAECLAETKWQLAELKMQIVDFLLEKLANE